MSEQRALVVNTLAYAVSMALISLRGLVVLPMFTRHLGAGEYGLFTQLAASVNLLLPLAYMRLDAAAVRFLASERDPGAFRDGFFSPLLAIIPLGSVVWLLFTVFDSAVAAAVLGDGTRGDVVPLLGPWLLVQAVGTYLLNYYRVVSRIAVLSWLRLVQAVLSTAALLLGLSLGGTVHAALLAVTAADGLFAIGLAVLTLSAMRLDAPFRRSPYFGPMLRYALPLLPNSFFGWLVTYADRLFVVQLFGQLAVGTYAVCNTLGSVPSLLITPLSHAIFPLLTRLYDDRRLDELRSVMREAVRVFVVLAAPIVAGMAALSAPLVHLLVGDRMTVQPSTVLLLGIGFLLHGVYQLNAYCFHLVRKTGYTTRILGAAVAINVTLDALLIAPFGLSGAAAASAVTSLVMVANATYHAKHMLDLRMPWPDLARAAISAGACAGVVMSLAPRSLPMIALAVAAGAAAWFVALWLLGGFRPEDRANLRALFVRT